ncbi:MAG TPA: alpha/beta hydrolase [Chitinophagaceae bacterium]|nr:alpha/beta hydrolase [Chitinophagaceae bacterium]
MLMRKTSNLLKLSVAFFIVFFALSCKKEGASPIELDAAKQQVLPNVMYGNDAAETMDVYLPAGRSASSTKILVLVHPGSWDEGDKADFDSAADTLRILLPGYAIFNINYRLALNGKNVYPAAFDDVGLAIKFIESKYTEYSVDTGKIVLGGASAGAHLAMLQAFKLPASNIKAVVDLFGPPDLAWLYTNHPFPQLAQPVLVNFLGVSLQQNASLYADASPINYVSSVSPPTIIFHGALDDVVPLEESQRLQAKLQSFNVPNALVVYNSEGHGWTGASLTDTYLKIAAFLNQYVQ